MYRFSYGFVCMWQPFCLIRPASTATQYGGSFTIETWEIYRKMPNFYVFYVRFKIVSEFYNLLVLDEDHNCWLKLIAIKGIGEHLKIDSLGGDNKSCPSRFKLVSWAGLQGLNNIRPHRDNKVIVVRSSQMLMNFGYIFSRSSKPPTHQKTFRPQKIS